MLTGVGFDGSQGRCSRRRWSGLRDVINTTRRAVGVRFAACCIIIIAWDPLQGRKWGGQTAVDGGSDGEYCMYWASEGSVLVFACLVMATMHARSVDVGLEQQLHMVDGRWSMVKWAEW
jgi:hypothetical protein